MNLLERLKYTYDFFRSGNDPTRYALTHLIKEHKKTPLLFNTRSSDQPQWSMVDYETFAREGFETNSVIYSAIMTKVRAISQVNLTASTGDIDSPEDIKPNNTRRDFTEENATPDENQNLANLLNRPNKYMSGTEFQQVQTVFLNITGNAFGLITRDKKTKLPNGIWPLNPANVQIVPDGTGDLRGYIYRPKGASGDDRLPILPDDMMHVKLPNPLDPLQGLGFGLSPILPLAKSADVDNQITSFLKVFFEHGAMPSGAIKLKDMMLDEDAIEEIKERFMSTYGNYENWADIAVLDMTMDYERIGLTFKEMDFSNLDSRNESRILLPFGVPAELLPIRLGLEGSTFANKEEARKWFWQDTMGYELSLFLDEYTAYLSTSTAFPRWDFSRVEALKENTKDRVESAVALVNIGVPPKIAFGTVGLEVEEYQGIDESRQQANPFGILPSGENQDNPNSDDNPEQNDNLDNQDANKALKKNYNFSEEQKQEIYTKVDNIAIQHENDFSNAAEKAFSEEKRKVLAIVNDSVKKARENKATLDGIVLMKNITDYLFSDGKDNWRNKFVPVVTTAMTDVGDFWIDQLGFTFDLRNIEGESWFQDYMLVFADPITDTSNGTIHNIISIALEDGWSNDQLANRLGDVYDQWITGGLDQTDFDWLYKPAKDPRFGNRILQWRRELIARTETTRAANAGANNFFKEWGVSKKEWLSTSDDRTRDSHKTMSGQTVDIDAKFVSGLGNKLKFPGDPDAPLADTAQCRCTILPAGDVIS